MRSRGAGEEETGPSPVSPQKGSKHHVITDAGGIPLVAETTAANVPDVNPMIPLIDAIPPVRGKPGRPRRRPDSLYGDRGYDSDPHRRRLRRRGIRPHIARGVGRPTGSGLGKSPLVRGADLVAGCTTSVGCAFGRTARRLSIRRFSIGLRDHLCKTPTIGPILLGLLWPTRQDSVLPSPMTPTSRHSPAFERS